VLLVALLFVGSGGNTAAQGSNGASFPGTWFLELDAEPFGLPPGIALPAFLTIHADGTLLIFDAGDFGAVPINLVQSPQFGTWSRAGHRSIVATTLFFAGDPFTRDTTLIKRVRLLIGFAGNDFDRLTGVAETVEQIECPLGPLPSFLNCPNPITAPDEAWVPEPGGAPDVPMQMWRLRAW
jgi:hypothetical protein